MDQRAWIYRLSATALVVGILLTGGACADGLPRPAPAGHGSAASPVKLNSDRCVAAFRIDATREAAPKAIAVRTSKAASSGPGGDGSGGDGILVHVMVGSDIGRSMQVPDLACLGWSLEHAADGGRTEWTNPDTGVTYRLRLRRTLAVTDHRVCREYVARARIDGLGKQLDGIACRQADGYWQVVN